MKATRQMHVHKSSLQRYPVASYFVLSFLLAWCVWIPIGIFVPNATTVFVLPGAWAPTVAAIVLSGMVEGRAGLWSLLNRVRVWQVHWLWYVFAILGPTAIALLAILTDFLLGGSAPSIAAIAARFGLAPSNRHFLWPMLPIIFLITIFFSGAIAEELGWRGFAQTRLQEQLGPARAGLVIGLIWSLWHLPLFAFLPSATGDVPLAWYIPLISAVSTIFGWVYSRTHGSVLVSIVFHAGINFMMGGLGLVTITGSRQLLTIFVTFTVACAIALSAVPGRDKKLMRPLMEP